MIYPLFYYLTRHHDLLFILTCMDSLMVSWNTIADMYSFTKIDLPDYTRYFYYLFLRIVYYLVHWMFYTTHSELLTFLLYMTCEPTILTWIMSLYNIKLKLNQVKHYITCHFIHYIITQVCIHTLHFNPYFSMPEIETLMNINNQQLNQFIKNVIISTTMKAISDGRGVTMTIIKNIYNTKATYPFKDPYPNQDDKIKTIILKRQWKELLNPYIIDLLLQLYHDRQLDQVVPNIHLLFYKLEMATNKVFLLLSMNQLLLLYTDYHLFLLCCISVWLHDNKMHKILLLPFSLFRLPGLLFIEYVDLCYPLIVWCTTQAMTWLNQNQHILIHCNDYNLYILLNILSINPVLSIMNAKYWWISFYFSFFGYFSSYNLFHLCYLAIVFYIGLNLYHSPTAPLKKIKMDIMPEYIPILKLLQNPNHLIPPV